ncbi:MAG: OprO/OprP family phosphate-selective porin [Leptospiraceae bacterium]|nr:OprO/OprP family phosphate-selective porin [Leptospiraceae bacterium]MDW8306176.1 porin [Leptospiraceae bacterium]
MIPAPLFRSGTFFIGICIALYAQEKSELSFIDQEQIGTTLKAAEDAGLVISNADGSYSMNLRARIQSRFTQTTRASQGAPRQTEFAVRRLRLSFRGNIHNPFWRYYIQFGFAAQENEQDVNSNLRDAVISYTRYRDININMGQMKVPFSRQRVSSSGNLQFPDRSRTSGELNMDRDIGISLTSSNLFNLRNFLGYALAVFGGEGRNRQSRSPGVMGLAKLFLSPFGPQDYLSEGDFQRYEKPKLTLGIAYAYNHNTERKLSTLGEFYRFSRFDYEHVCADFVAKWRGLSLTGEYLLRKANRPFHVNSLNPTEVEYSRSAWGYFLQAGYLFPIDVELAMRYGELFPLGETDPTLVYSRELGGGVSIYLSEHLLKIQADYFFYEGNFAIDRQSKSQEVRFQIQMVI